MRQVVITKYGPPDVLESRNAADLMPGSGDVRIAVRAAGVNFADVMGRLGLYPDAPKPPFVAGYEVAGLVDAVGSGVARTQVGDRVFALTRFGGYSTSVVVPEAFVFPLPSGLSDIEAAAVPVNYLTASIGLCRLANVAAGEMVVVHSAGGGVGVAATQLAKQRGAVVAGIASASKLEAIRRFGVDYPIDRTSDVATEIRRLTNGRGADVILDAIGGRSFATSYALLAPLGRLVIYGASSVAAGQRRNLWHLAKAMVQMPAFRPLSLMNRNRTVIGLNLGHLWEEVPQLHAAMDLIVRDMVAGRLRPVIAATFPLERAADAHRCLQSRSNVGKVVLTVD